MPSASDPHAGDKPVSFPAWRDWLITAPIALLLLLAIAFGTSAFIHGQLLSLGGSIWHDYNMLRFDMSQPSCNPNMDVDAEVQRRMANQKADTDSLFDTGPADPESIRQSLTSQREQCRENFEIYDYNREQTSTATLQSFRSVELAAGQLNTVGQAWQPYILVLLIIFGGLIATIKNEQISLRPPKSRLTIVCRPARSFWFMSRWQPVRSRGSVSMWAAIPRSTASG